MIVINSQETDYTTSEIIEWLNYYNAECIRINEDDEITLIRVKNDLSCDIEVNNTCFNTNDISSYYFRRGRIRVKINANHTDEIISSFMQRDASELSKYMAHVFLRSPITLGNPFLVSSNKLNCLFLARKAGFMTPETMVTSLRKDLVNFNKQPLITKSLHATPKMEHNGKLHNGYTALIDYKKLETPFSLSLFQTLIDKCLELRIFYLKGDCYTLAIDSQSNDQTKIDFRNYDKVNPNKTYAVKLPKYVIRQINDLMEMLSLDTGSIDILLDSKGNYIFLEVNPIGQYGMVSLPGFYELEKKVAQLLSNRKYE